jgi:hypothetical protein
MRNVFSHEKWGSLIFSKSLIRETRRSAAHVESYTQTLRALRSSSGPENTEEKRTPLQPGFALLVWAVWVAFGGRFAIYHLFADWKFGLTMVFGSLIGGGARAACD